MKICVCDDDKHTAEKIRGLIKEQTPEFQVDMFSCGEDVLSDGSFDIAFLDIQMSGASGIDTAAELKKRFPDIIIVFISSYSDYVTDAFSLEAFQYLVKPVDRDKFCEVFHKALDSYKKAHYLHKIHSNKGELYIPIRNIMYIETYGRRLRIWTNQDKFEYNDKIKSEYDKLRPFDFVRAHQGCIVNMQYVRNWTKTQFILKDGQCISIGRSYQNTAADEFTKYIGKVLV